MKRRTTLRNIRGETLVEALAAILIVALSSALLLLGVGAGARISRTSDAESERRSAGIAQAERQSAPGTPGTVTVAFAEGERTVDVTVYGGEEFASYRKADGR